MSKRKFHLKQAGNTGQGKHWMGLDFRSYMNCGDDGQLLSDPIIREVCGDEIDYGKLFAYLFRRFGYPMRGWDDYKELCTYYLTTPNSDLLLNITPYVSNTSVIAIRFLVPRAAFMEIEEYARRDRAAWDQRMYDWAEKQGLPDWMPDWLEIYNTEYREAFPVVPLADNWRQVINFPHALGKKGSRTYELTSRVSSFRNKLHEDFCKVEAWPAYYDRPGDWREMNDDDPLKSLAEAALIALRDLRTPVCVRDEYIDAFGTADDGSGLGKAVKAAKSAGYPCGALGNIAPEEFSELHGLVVKLGKGNIKRGIKKVLAAASPKEKKAWAQC